MEKPPRLLRALSDASRKRALSQCAVHHYAKGARIIRAGDESAGLHFIIRGRAQAAMTSGGDEVNFDDIERGGCFGALSLIDGGAHLMTVTALLDTQVIVMPAAIFDALAVECPALREALMHRVAAQVRELCARILAYSTLDVDGRVRAEMLRMARRYHVLGGVARIPHMTHARFAGRVSCGREAVSREMKKLQRADLVRKGKGEFIVPDIERLRREVEGE